MQLTFMTKNERTKERLHRYAFFQFKKHLCILALMYTQAKDILFYVCNPDFSPATSYI